MKKGLVLGLAVACTMFLCSCGDSKKSTTENTSTANQTKTLTVWSWNVAAKGLELTVPSLKKLIRVLK